LASTGTVVSSAWIRSAARTWRRINSVGGARLAVQAPTQSARVDTSSSIPSRIALALPVERPVLAELGVKDHRQQAGSGPRPGNNVKWIALQYFLDLQRQAGHSTPHVGVADG
jgi:hypothetical protein